MHRLPLVLILAVISTSSAFGQDASARTVQYHAQDIVPIHAKLKYTTLIEVPPTEKIMEAATGDKELYSLLETDISRLSTL
jgi:type IV secretion system protein VirB9